MAQGWIKIFFSKESPDRNGRSGYGFIATNGGGDLFFHLNDAYEVVSVIGETSLKGVKVEFSLEEGRTGKAKAAKIKLATTTTYVVEQHEEFVLNGCPLPVVRHTTKAGDKIISHESGATTVDDERRIKAEWPEDIRHQAKAMLNQYNIERAKAVGEIRWPEIPTGLENFEVPYDDGTLSGMVTSYVSVTKDGIKRSMYLNAKQIPGTISREAVLVSEVIKQDEYGRNRMETPQEFQQAIASLGQPQKVTAVFTDYVGNGEVVWTDSVKAMFDPAILFETSNSLVTLGEVVDTRGESKYDRGNIRYSLEVTIPCLDFTVQVEGFRLIDERLKQESWTSSSDKGVQYTIGQLQNQAGPIVTRAGFNKWGAQFTPQDIKDQLAGFVRRHSSQEWQERWRELVLAWDGDFDKTHRIYREMTELLEKILAFEDLLENSPTYSRREFQGSSWVPESPDGMRGGYSETTYHRVTGLSWGGEIEQWRSYKRQEDQTMEDVWRDLVAIETAELQELCQQWAGWLKAEVVYEGDTEPGWYDVPAEVVNPEALSELRQANAEKADSLLAGIDKLVVASEAWYENYQAEISRQQARYNDLEVWHNQVAEMRFKEGVSSKACRSYSEVLAKDRLGSAKWRLAEKLDWNSGHVRQPAKAAEALDSLEQMLQQATGQASFQEWQKYYANLEQQRQEAEAAGRESGYSFYHYRTSHKPGWDVYVILADGRRLEGREEFSSNSQKRKRAKFTQIWDFVPEDALIVRASRGESKRQVHNELVFDRLPEEITDEQYNCLDHLFGQQAVDRWLELEPKAEPVDSDSGGQFDVSDLMDRFNN